MLKIQTSPIAVSQESYQDIGKDMRPGLFESLGFRIGDTTRLAYESLQKSAIGRDDFDLLTPELKNKIYALDEQKTQLMMHPTVNVAEEINAIDSEMQSIQDNYLVGIGRYKTVEELKDLSPDIEWSRPTSESIANIRIERKTEDMLREQIVASGPQGLPSQGLRLVADIVGTMIDPIELASAFVPIVGQQKYAQWILKYGRYSGRLRAGAIEGLAGAVLTEPLYYNLSKAAQRDYGYTDALLNMTVGAVLGGGIGLTRGRLSSRTQADLELAARGGVPTPEEIEIKRQTDIAMRTAEDTPLRPLQDLGTDPTIKFRETTYRVSGEFINEKINMGFKQFLNTGRVDLNDGDIRAYVPESLQNGKIYIGETTLPDGIKNDIAPYVTYLQVYKTLANAQKKAMITKGDTTAAEVVSLPDGTYRVRKKTQGEIVRNSAGKPMLFKDKAKAQQLIDADERLSGNSKVIELKSPEGSKYIIGIKMSDADIKLISTKLTETVIPIGISSKKLGILTNEQGSLKDIAYGSQAKKIQLQKQKDFIDSKKLPKKIDEINNDFEETLNSLSETLDDATTLKQQNDILQTTLFERAKLSGYDSIILKDAEKQLDEAKLFNDNLQKIFDDIKNVITKDGTDEDIGNLAYIYVKNDKYIPHYNSLIKDWYSHLSRLEDPAQMDQEIFDLVRKYSDNYEHVRLQILGNEIKTLNLLDAVEAIKSTDPKQFNKDPMRGLKDAISGSWSNRKNTGINVSTLGATTQNQLMLSFFIRAQDKNLWEIYQKLEPIDQRALENTIELVNRSNPALRESIDVSDEIYDLAVIVSKSIRDMRNIKNEAGASIKFLEGYISGRLHDVNKIVNDRAGWTAWMLDRVDFDAIDVPRLRQQEFIDQVYELISEGKASKQDDNDVIKLFSDVYRSPANMARRLEQNRSIKFKTGADEYDYRIAYGKKDKSFQELLVRDMNVAGNQVALLKILGTNPEMMIRRVKDLTAKKYPDLKNQIYKPEANVLSPEGLLREEMGALDYIATDRASKLTAAIGKFLRAASSWGKLGKAGFYSLSDITSTFARGGFIGQNLFESLSQSFTIPFKGASIRWNNEQKKLYASSYIFGNELHLGATAGKLGVGDDMEGWTGWVLQKYFTLNGLLEMTSVNKTGYSLVVQQQVASLSKKSWDQLPELFKIKANEYRINETNWEVARLAIIEVNGVKLWDAEALEKIALTKFGLPTRQENITAMKDLKISIMTFIDQELEVSSPTPDSITRAITKGGMPPSSVYGQLIRSAFQFKSWGIAMTKNYAQLGATGQYARIGVLGAYQIIVGAGLIQAGYYLSNKTALKWDHIEDNFGEFLIAAGTRGGTGGILYDLATDNSDRWGGDILDPILGPTFQAFADTVSIVSGARDEALGIKETERAGPAALAKTLKVLQPLLPGTNLPIVGDIFNYFIFYPIYEWANPGYLQRMKNRLERETGQEYLIDPALVVD